MKKVLVSEFKNKEGEIIPPPPELIHASATQIAIPVDEIDDLKEIGNEVQGSYSSSIIVTGRIIELG